MTSNEDRWRTRRRARDRAIAIAIRLGGAARNDTATRETHRARRSRRRRRTPGSSPGTRAKVRASSPPRATPRAPSTSPRGASPRRRDHTRLRAGVGFHLVGFVRRGVRDRLERSRRDDDGVDGEKDGVRDVSSAVFVRGHGIHPPRFLAERTSHRAGNIVHPAVGRAPSPPEPPARECG